MSTETANPFLTWAPPDQSLVIHIDYTVMERLHIEVMRGFGVTRRRGTEAGGILIGRIDRRVQPVIHIQSFEAVPCEYASGPSYVLSAADQQKFKDAAAKWQPSLERDSYAVGYFRSHTRAGFALDDKDANVMREFFPDPLDIALLIKPFATRPASAGFFLKDKGTLVTGSTPLEFTFEPPPKPRDEQAIPEPAAPVEAAPAKTAARPSALSPPPPAPPAVYERELFVHTTRDSSGWTRRLSWTAFCLALLVFGAACGYEYAGRQSQKAMSPTGLPNADLYAVRLQVAPLESGVMVKWDKDAVPIQGALHGLLTVTEGPNSKEVKLGFAELRNGTAMYPHLAPEIRFRLQLFFKDNRSFIETAEYRQAAIP